MSIEVMKKAAAAFDKIIDGCNGIEEEDTHPEAKKVARLVRKDCLRALKALRQAIAEAEKPWVKTYAGGKPNYTTQRKEKNA